MSETTPGQAPGDSAAGRAAVAAVGERLMAILDAVEACRVGTNGDELWFESRREPGVQLRLREAGAARAYDHSANFALGYTGPSSEGAVAPAVVMLVGRIKALDATPIAGAAVAFRAAAAEVAARCSPPAAAPEAPAPAVWEHPRTRALNVIFLDLCAGAFGQPGEPLAPLHWGYWPSGADPAAMPRGYDSTREFSNQLLACIPPGVRRVLDVGCGLGFNAKLLSARQMQVTAVSPIAHHCELIERAALPGVEVVCSRFQDLAADRRYDLLLFSESLNHFALDEAFLRHCASFLVHPGYLLLADDLTEERARWIETQPLFRILRAVDITENVAPMRVMWMRDLPVVAAYHAALLSILQLYDPALAAGVRGVLDQVENPELKCLLSGQLRPPEPKGRYMIYLLEPSAAERGP